MFKKSLMALVAIMLGTAMASAESVNESVTQVSGDGSFLNSIQVTPRVGLSSFTLNTDSENLAFDSERGFAIGVTAEKKIRSFLGIEAGLMYLQTGGSTKASGDFAFAPGSEGEMSDEFEEGFGEGEEGGFDGETELGSLGVRMTVRTEYLGVPIHAKLYPSASPFYVRAGIMPAILLSAKSKLRANSGGVSNSVTANVADQFDSVDFMGSIGMGTVFSANGLNISVDGALYNSLVSAASVGDIDGRNMGFILSAGVPL